MFWHEIIRMIQNERTDFGRLGETIKLGRGTFVSPAEALSLFGVEASAKETASPEKHSVKAAWQDPSSSNAGQNHG